jgi:hypothetical protein
MQGECDIVIAIFHLLLGAESLLEASFQRLSRT